MNAPAVSPRPVGVGCFIPGELEKRYVSQVLESGRLSYGPWTQRLEREFAQLHGRGFAIFCNSGTSALQVAVHALKHTYGWQDGDEVLVPAVTFVASSNVVLQNELRPVFVDVDPQYYEMDPALIEARIGPRTRALMPVHLFGQPCDMAPIMEIAAHRRLCVLEDSCEAMFVRYRGQPVGSWGQAACFSTYIAHLIVTGVGGFATTNDPDLAVLMRSLCNHGRDGIYLSIDDTARAAGERFFEMVSRRFSFQHTGYSYRATEMEAAIGMAQLESREAMMRARRHNAARLTEGLRSLEAHIQLPAIRPETEHAFMMYPIVLRAGLPRDPLILFLESWGIETRYMLPLVNQPVYIKIFGNIEHQYPVAKWINDSGFYIGCHQGLSDSDVDYVVERFHAYFLGADRRLGPCS